MKERVSTREVENRSGAVKDSQKLWRMLCGVQGREPDLRGEFSETTSHPSAVLLGCPLSHTSPDAQISAEAFSLLWVGAFPRVDSLPLQPSDDPRRTAPSQPKCQLPAPPGWQVLLPYPASPAPGAPAALGQNGRKGARERRSDTQRCRGRMRAFPKVSMNLGSLSGAKGLGKWSQPSGTPSAGLRQVVSILHPSEPPWEFKEKEQQDGINGLGRLIWQPHL